MFDNLRNVLDFDDLLFEKRNQEYGAYQLRKRYNSVVIAGIILSAIIVTIAVVVPFIFSSGNDRVLRGGYKNVQITMENLDRPIDEILIPPAPPPPEVTKIQEVVKYIPPVIIDSLVPLESTHIITDEFLRQSPDNNIEINGTGTGDDMFQGQDGSGSNDFFVMVEVMPSFKGGDISKFREWVGKRTNYPQAAYEKRIRGTVFLTFIVEKDGSVSNVTVVKGVDPLLDNEAVRAITESPKWTPGLQRGQPVRVRFSIPLNFMF